MVPVQPNTSGLQASNRGLATPVHAKPSVLTPTKQAWTPGPWRISGAAEGAGITIEAKRNSLIAFVRDSQHPLTDVQEHEATANAKLIAKAPQSTEKLLEFYEAAKSWHSVHGHGRDSVQCDEFCRLMNEAEPVLREAGAL